MVTSVFIWRGFQARTDVKNDAQYDAAYVLQGALTSIEHKAGTTWLAVGDEPAFAYRGRFPFRQGEIVTLSVSNSGSVLTVNGNRAPLSEGDALPASTP